MIGKPFNFSIFLHSTGWKNCNEMKWKDKPYKHNKSCVTTYHISIILVTMLLLGYNSTCVINEKTLTPGEIVTDHQKISMMSISEKGLLYCKLKPYNHSFNPYGFPQPYCIVHHPFDRGQLCAKKTFCLIKPQTLHVLPSPI